MLTDAILYHSVAKSKASQVVYDIPNILNNFL